jgi:hypothetical protein
MRTLFSFHLVHLLSSLLHHNCSQTGGGGGRRFSVDEPSP